ncbi:MAG: hypothetical protein ACK5NK_13280 [Niabella sp.]
MKKQLKILIAPFYYKLMDVYDSIIHSDQQLLPPRGIRFVGNGDFIKAGTHFVEIFKDKAQLSPNAKVLDVGCGIGRMAIPLTKYLNADGGVF